MNFTQRLCAVQEERNTLLCIGLDPDLQKLPRAVRGLENPILEFNRRIIESTAEFVCAYKLNLAFYESAGERGAALLKNTLSLIPEAIITIGDAKRGDIGNSSEMYARALLDQDGFTATTVNPYLGFDSVEPFLRRADRGTFILSLTSNPGAKDFQYLKAGSRPLYEHVIRKVKRWNTRENCGLVVGATRPRELQQIRRLVPKLPLLIPGIGAQGGDLERAVRFGCNRSGLLAVITASRSILYASSNEDFAEAARLAAQALREQINLIRGGTPRRAR
jgi:orotidine-5'-phosphate decarboxylase